MTVPTPRSINLSEEARKLLSDGANSADNLGETLLTVTAVNITPVIPGGPFTDTIKEINGEPHWEGIRPTAIRGVWRWWVRTLLAGTLWEEGKRDYNYQTLAKMEAKELGLGSINVSDEIRGEASNVILDVKVLKIPRPLSREEFSKRMLKTLLLIPRYKLLTMGRDKEVALYKKQPIPPGKLHLKITLLLRGNVKTSLKAKYRRILTAALILALSLGGIGQMTSRGFGKFRVIVDDGKEQEFARKVLKILTRGSGGKIPEEIIKLISASDDIRGYIERKENDKVPDVPTFHKDTMIFKDITLTVQPQGKDNIWRIISYIGSACLKIRWKSLFQKKMRLKSKKVKSVMYHTWPLGLPRHVRLRIDVCRGTQGSDISEKCTEIKPSQRVTEGKISVYTGYRILENEQIEDKRLASLVKFAIITKDNGRTQVSRILIYAFRTRDLRVLRGKLIQCRAFYSYYNRREFYPRMKAEYTKKIKKNRCLRKLTFEKIDKYGIYDPSSGTIKNAANEQEYLNVAVSTIEKLLKNYLGVTTQ